MSAALQAISKAESVDFGRRTVVIRAASMSVRLSFRTVAVGVVLIALTLLACLFGLGFGSFQVSVPDVAKALLGQGPEIIQTLVVKWRLSRVVLAVLIGLALGLSGAIFQSLTRNPLGSPDVVGFSTGAYTGTLIAIVFIGTSQGLMIGGALVGGIATALGVYLLAYKRGVHGFRLIVVGIALTAMLGSVNSYLLLNSELWQAKMAAVWGAGSINGLDWSEVRVVAIALAIVVPPTLLLSRQMNAMEMGDDASAALGIRVEPIRLALVVLGVALIAVTSAFAGPIAFVALAAPHIARALTRGTGALLVPSAIVGAALLVVCDIIAQWIFEPIILPVGLVTIVLGGAYLVWLLSRQTRREYS